MCTFPKDDAGGVADVVGDDGDEDYHYHNPSSDQLLQPKWLC